MDPVVTSQLPHQYHRQVERLNYNVYDNTRRQGQATQQRSVPSRHPNVVPSAPQRGGTVESSSRLPVQFSSSSAASASSTVLRCTCCPYGYHIDLGFLGFLDATENLSQLRKIHRRRTIQRQTMETDLLMPRQDERFRQRYDISDGASTSSSMRSDDEDVSTGQNDTASTSRLLEEIDASIIDALSSIDVLMTSKPTAADVDDGRSVRDRVATVYDNEDATSAASIDGGSNELERRRGVRIEESSSSSSVSRRSAWVSRGQSRSDTRPEIVSKVHRKFTTLVSSVSSSVDQPPVFSSSSLELTPKDGLVSKSAFTGTFASFSSNCLSSGPSSVFTSFNDDSDQSPMASPYGANNIRSGVSISASTTSYDNVPSARSHFFQPKTPDIVVADSTAELPNRRSSATPNKPVATPDQVAPHLNANNTNRTTISITTSGTLVPSTEISCGDDSVHLVSRNTPMQTSHTQPSDVGGTTERNSSTASGTKSSIPFKLRPLKTISLEQRMESRGLRAQKTAFVTDASVLSADSASSSSPEPSTSTTADTEAARSISARDFSTIDDSSETPPRIRIENSTNMLNGGRRDISSVKSFTSTIESASTSNELFQSDENIGTSKPSELRATQPPQQLHDHFHRRQHHQQQQRQQQQLRSSMEQSSLSQNDEVDSGDVRHTFQFPVGEVDNVETDLSNEQSTSSSEQLARAMEILMPIETSSTSDIDSRSSSVAVSPASTIDPDALIDIRRHIAASLQQMRFLERQVKAIPMLQVRLSVLKEEKRLLQLQLLSAKNIAAAAMAPTPTNANIRREDAGVQTLLNLDDVVSKKGHQTNVDGETESCSAVKSGDAMVHSSQPYVCSKCRTCFEKIDELVEQSSMASKASMPSTNEHEQQRHDAIHRLSPTSSPSESIVDTTRFMPTETSTKSLSSTTVKSVSGSVRPCRVVVADDEFGETVDALVSQHSTRLPEEVKTYATSGHGAKRPPVARKEISIGTRDDKLQRRNVGVQCVLPTSDTSKSRFQSSPPPPSPKTVSIESKNSTDSVRISRRSSNGREPDLVVAHVTSSVPITEFDTVEENACRSRSVEEFHPRDAFYRKPDLIETGVNTDFVRIVNNELEDDVDVSGMNVHKGVVIRRSMPNQTDGDGDGREVSERSEFDLVECALASTGVEFIDSSKSFGVRSNQESVMTSPPCVHTETQTDICGPVTIVSMCGDSKSDAAIPQRRPRDSYFKDLHCVTETSDDADCRVIHARRPASRSASNSMNSEDSSSDWSVSSAVRMNTDDVTCVLKKDEVRELLRMTPSPQHRETTTEASRSAVVRMPPTGRTLRKKRDSELWMLSHLDLQFSRQSTVGENISWPVRHQFDPTIANETAIAECCVCSGSRLTGDRVLDNATPEVMVKRMLKATCDVACNTPPLSQSATRETATITDDVRLRPLTVETGCDPLRIDVRNISLRLGDWSETIPSAIVSERELMPAENEISFVNVTSSLPTSRTETAEVACETDSILNSNLAATISDGQFPTVMSRCFNDAGCNTFLTQTIDSSSNTDDFTSGKPTPLTIEASCCTDAITTSDVTCYTDHVITKPMMIDSSCGSDVHFELCFNDFTCNPATTFTRINTFVMGMNTDPSVVYLMADKPETHDNGTNTDEQTADTLVTKTAVETAERDDKERHSFLLRSSTTETGCDPIQIDDSDIPIGRSEKLTTCPSEMVLERNVAAAENELVSSAIFVSVTSSLSTSRTKTTEVACETDSTLNSNLSATVNDDQFPTVMSHCFNDAGCNTVLTQTIDSSSNTDDVTSGKPTPLTIEASCCTDAITTSDVTCYTDHVITKPMMIDSSCGSDVHFELCFNDFTCNPATTFTRINTFEMGMNTDPSVVYLMADKPETHDNGTNTDEQTADTLVTKTAVETAERDDKERHSFLLRSSTTETGCDPIQIDDSDIPIGRSEKLTTCPSEMVLERNVAAAENELVSSAIFVSVTSSLSTSRTKTTEVACETDSTLNSNLSATVNDDQFPTVMSHCFNDAGCNTVLTQTIDSSSNTDDVTSGKPTPLTIEASCCTDAITTSDVTCFMDHVIPKPMMIDSSCGSDVHFERCFNLETASTKANTFEMGINTDPCVVYLRADVPETHDNGTNTDEHTAETLVANTATEISRRDNRDCHSVLLRPQTTETGCDPIQIDTCYISMGLGLRSKFEDSPYDTQKTFTKAYSLHIGVNTDAVVINSSADVPETHDSGTNTDEQTAETLVTTRVAESNESVPREYLDVSVRPLTAETGCDPIQIDDIDSSIGLGKRSITIPPAIISERELASTVISSTSFPIVTSLLPISRTETAEVACETDSILNYELLATISDDQFRTAVSRCFNDAGCNTVLTQTIDSSSNTDDVTSGKPTPLTIEASCCTDAITTSDVICYTDHVIPKPMMIDSSCGSNVHFELCFNLETASTKANTFEMGINTDPCVVYLRADVPETHDNGTNTDEQTGQSLVTKTVAVLAKPDSSDCACEAKLVIKPDVVDAASNTDTVEQGSQESSHNVDRTSDQVAYQSRAVGTVRPRTAAVEDSFSSELEMYIHTKYALSMMTSTTVAVDNAIGSVLSDAGCPAGDRRPPYELSRVVANITRQDRGSPNGAVDSIVGRVLLGQQEKSTQTAALTVGDLSGLVLLEDSDGKSDELLRRPSREDIAEWSQTDGAFHTEHRMYVRTRSLGADVDLESVSNSQLHHASIATAAVVQASTVTRDVLPPPPAALVKSAVTDAASEIDDEFRTLAVDDVTVHRDVRTTSFDSRYLTRDTRRSITNAIDKGESVTYFNDFTVPSIDTETEMTEVFRDRKTTDDGIELMDAIRTQRPDTCDASCNTDETRMNSASVVSCSVDGGRRLSTELYDIEPPWILSRRSPHAVGDDSTTTVERHVTHVATELPVCPVSKPLVRDAACNTDVTNDNDIKVFVKPLTRETASNTESPPHSRDVFGNTNQIDDVKPEVADFACYVNLPRESSSSVGNAARTTVDLEPDKGLMTSATRVSIRETAADELASKSTTSDSECEIGHPDLMPIVDMNDQRQKRRITSHDGAVNSYEAGKSSLATADLYTENVPSINSLTSADIVAMSATRTVVSMQSGAMLVENVKPSISAFGCSFNNVAHQGHVADASCLTDLMSSVEVSVCNQFNVIRELEPDKSIATSTRRKSEVDSEVGVDSFDSSGAAPLASVDFGCGVDMTVELGMSVTVDASCNTESASTLYAMDVEYASDDITIADSSDATVDPDSVTSSVPVQAQTVTIRVAMVEAESNTDRIQVLTIQEYEDLISFVTAMKSSAPIGRDLVTVTTGDARDSASAAAACSSMCSTETVEDLHRDVIDFSCTANTIDDIALTSSTLTSPTDDSFADFADFASKTRVESSSTSNKVDSVIRRPTTADASCGSETSKWNAVSDVTSGDDVVFEVVEAAASPAAVKLSTAEVGCCTEPYRSGSTAVAVKDAYNDAREFPVSEASSNMEKTVYCSRCLCGEPTSGESASVSQSNDAKNGVDSSAKLFSVSVGCSTDIRQVAEVASGIDIDYVSSSVALRSCETETRDQCCNTEPQLEVQDTSTFESMATLTDGGGVEQPRRRRTLSSSLYSPMSSNSAASASKIPTRRRSAKTHDSAVNTNVTTTRDSAANTDITIAPCTMATVDLEEILITKGQSLDANLPAFSAAAAKSGRTDSDVPTIDQPTVMPTMSGHPNRNVEMRTSVQNLDVGCCAIPASVDVSCGTDHAPVNAVSASASTTGNRVRRTSSESREKLGGKAYAADSAVARKKPPMRNVSCTADLGASTLAAATTAAEVSLPSPMSVTSSSSLRTPTSDVACGTDFEFLSRIAASSDNDTSHFNWHSLASMRTPVAATFDDDDDENATSGSIRRSRPRRLDLDEVRDVACNTEHDSKPISGVLTSPYFARGVSYFPPPVSTADVACETDPTTDAVAGVVSSASDHIHRSAPPSLDVGGLQAVAPSSDSRRSLSSGGNRMFDAMSAEKTFRGTRLSYSEGSLAVFDDKNNHQQGGGDYAIEQNAEVVGHKASPTSEALATLRQYITHNLREQRKQVDVTQTVVVRSPVTLCDISVGPDESHIDDQPPSSTSTTTVTIGNSMTVMEPPSDKCDQSDSRVRLEITVESGHQGEDLHRLKPPVGDTEDGSFHQDTVGDLRSAASHDKVDERSKNIGVQTEAVDELAMYSSSTDATIHHSSTDIKMFAQLADWKRKTKINKAVNTAPASTRTKSTNTVPLAVQTKWTMTEDQLDTANRFVQIPTITIDDCGTPSALPSSIHQRPVTQSTEDFNNNRQHPARVSIRSNVVISSVATGASSPKSETLGGGDADNEQNSPRLSAGSETDVSRTTELPPSGGSSAASHLTRRWGTVDLSEEKQSPTVSASGGRKRPGTSASCSSSTSSVAMTTTSFKSILKHSRSVDTNTQSGLNKTVPRKAISFSQDVIFKGEVEDEFVPDSSSSFEGEVFSDDSSRITQTSYESLLKYSTTTEATSTVQLEMRGDLSSACETYALWLRDSTEVTSKKLNHSIKVIRNEWFAMTCQKTSLSELVAGFLRQMSELSLDLLKQVVNMVDDNGNTAIHYAMSNGRFDVVRCLLDSGCCDVGRQNRTGCTAIMLASLVPVSTDDDRQVIERLMTVGDVNQRAALAGQTALMLAASRNRGDIVRLLLDAGADVNAQDDDGSTAVMCASEHGFVDVVRMLLSHPECDPTVVDNEGSSATSIAIEAGHQDIAVLLYAHSNFKKTSSTSKRRRLKLPKTSTSSDPKSPKTT